MNNRAIIIEIIHKMMKTNHSTSKSPIASMNYWSQPLESVLKVLNADISGLNTDDSKKRLQDAGLNTIEFKKRTTPLGLFISQFKSPIILILISATIVSAFLKDWIDSIIILLIVLGSALLSFFQEYNAHNAAEKLKAQVSHKSEVLRDGKITLIPSEEIVAGDVIYLSAGSLIPADGLILVAKDFFVNQAVLTGETFPVEKKPGVVDQLADLAQRVNMVFMGTNVSSGSAKVLVVETGPRTAFGQIADKLTLRPPENEFQHGIRKLGYLLTEIMFVLVIGIFFFNVLLHKPALDSLLFSIALAVGLTPQLLPAIININLSKGSEKMAEHGVIVRRLESIENFGSMDILCTDKTGTITQGVVQLDRVLGVNGEPSEQVHLYAYLNAKFQTGLTNPMDEAISHQAINDNNAYEKVDEIPYDFLRKRLTVVIRTSTTDIMITKGALDNVLSVCTQMHSSTGEIPLDKVQLQQIQGKFEEWSSQGYRVLGVAIKTVGMQDHPFSVIDEADLTFVGFLLFFDPPKEGVKTTIEELEKMGVKLKIITGDNRLVARHVGQEIGLGDFQVLSGNEMNDLHDEALWHAVEKTTIFAEVDPNQKERIILALKKRGHVVGYMGDGINDAPSLHSADVGISVDNAVDVAKETADLVLLKQDLDVLREGIVQGRKTFANTMKYVFMATSANFGNMFSVAGASLFLAYLPMLPKQILLINFLTDLPEMTIAGDNVDDAFVKRPHRWNINFIRRFMLIFGPLSSLFDFATFAVLLWIMKANEATFHTGWFIESILSAGAVVFALRTRLPFWKSKPIKSMLVMTLVVMMITLILPYTPIAKILGFAPLSLIHQLVLIAIVLLYFISAEITKHWFYKKLRGES